MKDSRKIAVIGASGFGRESLDVLEAMIEDGQVLKISGVVDDAPSLTNLQRLDERGIAYLGTIDSWLASSHKGDHFVLGIGNPFIRKTLVERLTRHGLRAFTAIHPNTTFGRNTTIGDGAVICSGAVLSTNVHIGNQVHVNPNATIGHDVVIHNFASINPGSVISGEVTIHTEVTVGASATVLQNLSVGSGSVVGAGSVVTKDVPPRVTVKGVPGSWSQ